MREIFTQRAHHITERLGVARAAAVGYGRVITSPGWRTRSSPPLIRAISRHLVSSSRAARATVDRTLMVETGGELPPAADRAGNLEGRVDPEPDEGDGSRRDARGDGTMPSMRFQAIVATARARPRRRRRSRWAAWSVVVIVGSAFLSCVPVSAVVGGGRWGRARPSRLCDSGGLRRTESRRSPRVRRCGTTRRGPRAGPRPSRSP